MDDAKPQRVLGLQEGRLVLSRRVEPRGFSLIELMVTLTILGLALMMGMPSFSAWLQNSKLRSAAESVLSGLQFAKAEAVSRNALVRFQLTSTLDNNCALSATSPNWIVNTDPDPAALAGLCGALPSDTDTPFIVRKRDATSDPTALVVNSDLSNVVFNGLGRPVVATAMNIDFSMDSSVGTCAASGGAVTCLRVVVSPAGQIRMCNPKFSLPDPQGC
jgi:type IV fimbrial biogenesis protein FimT